MTSVNQNKEPKTYYGWLCGADYTDYDGSHETAEWIEPYRTEPDPIPDTMRVADSLGWWAECLVEPDMCFVGPFETKEEAIKVATDEDAFLQWIHQDDDEEPVYPLGRRAGNC